MGREKSFPVALSLIFFLLGAGHSARVSLRFLGGHYEEHKKICL